MDQVARTIGAMRVALARAVGVTGARRFNGGGEIVDDGNGYIVGDLNKRGKSPTRYTITGNDLIPLPIGGHAQDGDL